MKKHSRSRLSHTKEDTLNAFQEAMALKLYNNVTNIDNGLSTKKSLHQIKNDLKSLNLIFHNLKARSMWNNWVMPVKFVSSTLGSQHNLTYPAETQFIVAPKADGVRKLLLCEFKSGNFYLIGAKDSLRLLNFKILPEHRGFVLDTEVVELPNGSTSILAFDMIASSEISLSDNILERRKLLVELVSKVSITSTKIGKNWIYNSNKRKINKNFASVVKYSRLFDKTEYDSRCSDCGMFLRSALTHTMESAKMGLAVFPICSRCLECYENFTAHDSKPKGETKGETNDETNDEKDFVSTDACIQSRISPLCESLVVKQIANDATSAIALIDSNIFEYPQDGFVFTPIITNIPKFSNSKNNGLQHGVLRFPRMVIKKCKLPFKWKPLHLLGIDFLVGEALQTDASGTRFELNLMMTDFIGDYGYFNTNHATLTINSQTGIRLSCSKCLLCEMDGHVWTECKENGHTVCENFEDFRNRHGERFFKVLACKLKKCSNCKKLSHCEKHYSSSKVCKMCAFANITAKPTKLCINIPPGPAEWAANRVIEAVYDFATSQFRFVRVRFDKTQANSLEIANRVLEIQQNPLKLKDILNLCKFPSKTNTAYRSQMMIPDRKSRFSSLRECHLGLKKYLCKHFGGPCIIDACSGALPDLQSWVTTGVRNVVAIEMDDDLVSRARARVAELAPSSTNVRIIHEDMTDPQLSIADELRFLNVNDGVDTVFCNFAIHYMWSTKDLTTRFLDNIIQDLKLNGRVVVTFMHGGKDITSPLKIFNSEGELEFEAVPVENTDQLNVFVKSIGSVHVEAVVGIAELEKRFLKHGLWLMASIPFSKLRGDAFYDLELSAAEEQMSDLYSAAVFVKVPMNTLPNCGLGITNGRDVPWPVFLLLLWNFKTDALVCLRRVCRSWRIAIDGMKIVNHDSQDLSNVRHRWYIDQNCQYEENNPLSLPSQGLLHRMGGRPASVDIELDAREAVAEQRRQIQDWEDDFSD